jgi:hypothetical protein
MVNTGKPTQRGNACLTCKIRRVKCSYERPSCHRCLDTGRKCDGYRPSKPKHKPAAPVAIMVVLHRPPPSPCDHQALTAFQFFREACAPALLNYGSEWFWNSLVLQASYVDEGIKHLTIAASRLSRIQWAKGADEDAMFLSHYGKALKALSMARNPDPAFLLIACLLLILCDEFQNNPFAALQHLIAGRKILAAYPSTKIDHRQVSTMEQIGPIFARLEVQTGELYCQLRPLSDEWQLKDMIERKGCLVGDIQHFVREWSKPRAPSAWPTTLEAAASLQDIAFECTSLSRTQPARDAEPPRTRFHTVPHITDRLNDWLDNYTCLETQLTVPALLPPPYTTTLDLHVLRTYQFVVHILSRCSLFTRECAFDAYAPNIEHVSVTMGFLIHTAARLRCIPILFVIATRYRDASYRRRAITMLRSCGLDGLILAKLAMRIVRIEERDIANPVVCADVPEHCRLRIVDLIFDEHKGNYVLRYRRMPYGEGTALEQTELTAHAWAWDCGVQKHAYAVSKPPLSSHKTKMRSRPAPCAGGREVVAKEVSPSLNYELY